MHAAVSKGRAAVGKEHSASLLTTYWLHWPQPCPALARSVLKLLPYKTFIYLPLVPSKSGDIIWDILSETS